MRATVFLEDAAFVFLEAFFFGKDGTKISSSLGFATYGFGTSKLLNKLEQRAGSLCQRYFVRILSARNLPKGSVTGSKKAA